MKTSFKKLQRGYTMIELSIALAIIGVVIGGSIIGVQSILRTNAVNKTVAQSNTATNRIVARLARDANYAGATLQNLTRSGADIWEQNSITDGGLATASVRHFLNNNVLIASLSADEQGVDAGQGYVYTLTGVPVAACADLAAGVEGLAVAMGIVNENATAVVPTTALTGAAMVKQPGTPFTSAAATNACAGGAGATQNATIRLLIPRR